jgi:hypothetical protein
VSQTSDPTGSWTIYAFPEPQAGDLMDQPRFAISGTAIFMTANQFTSGATVYGGPILFAVNKSQIESGASTSYYYATLSTFYDTVNPARTLGTALEPYQANGYFLAADDGVCPPTCSHVYVWRWTNPFGGTNVLSFQGSATIPTFAQPVPAVQKGTGGTINTNDNRDLAAWLFKGTIYGAHTISCNPGTGTVDCVQWYQVGGLNTTPTIIQKGTIANNGVYRYFPAVTVDKSGDMSISYTESSATKYASLVDTGRLSTAGHGTVQAEALLKLGQASNPNGARWGDYGSAELSTDGCTMYHSGEYTPSNPTVNIWATWIGWVKFSTC